MNPQNFQMLQPSLHDTPQRMIASTRTPKPRKSLISIKFIVSKEKIEPLVALNANATTVLKNIQGYDHGGLNEYSPPQFAWRRKNRDGLASFNARDACKRFDRLIYHPPLPTLHGQC